MEIACDFCAIQLTQLLNSSLSAYEGERGGGGGLTLSDILLCVKLPQNPLHSVLKDYSLKQRSKKVPADKLNNDHDNDRLQLLPSGGW